GRGYGIDLVGSSAEAANRLDTVDLFDVQSQDIALSRLGDSLVINLANSSDKLTVDYFFTDSSTASTVKDIKFADGVVWDIEQIKARTLTQGTAGDDQLSGSSGADMILAGAGADTVTAGAGNDRIFGEAGDDVLYGDEGDDIIDGGAGNDTLYGGLGADTFRFGRGYGIDLVGSSAEAANRLDTVDLFDVQSQDIALSRLGDSLVINLANSSDKLTVDYFFTDSSTASTVKDIKFADGVVWDIEQIKARTLTQGT
ncbi:calcium-binding protein, partial [Pseudomonas graminis]|uniref:calcium-binding protein n=1 Tax=Pseudomonas graminis TaxID=158627 RepID=UPI003C14A3E0